jgi:hypothetical protein
MTSSRQDSTTQAARSRVAGHAAFLDAVALQLHTRGVAFDHTDLAGWLDAVWPLVEDRQDACMWAREYVAA